MRDVFVSHSSKDRARVDTIVADLERGGLSCWVAHRDVPGGSAFRGKIVDAIQQSRGLLLAFSRHANASSHVLAELDLAEKYGKKVYPLRIDDSEPRGDMEYALSNKQWIRTEVMKDRLADTVVALLEGRDPPQFSVQRDARARPMIFLASGALVVAIGATAVWWTMQSRVPSAPSQSSNPAPLGIQSPISTSEAFTLSPTWFGTDLRVVVKKSRTASAGSIRVFACRTTSEAMLMMGETAFGSAAEDYQFSERFNDRAVILLALIATQSGDHISQISRWDLQAHQRVSAPVTRNGELDCKDVQGPL